MWKYSLSRITTTQFFLLSALSYATIPVLLSQLDEESLFGLPSMLIAIKVAFSLPLLLRPQIFYIFKSILRNSKLSFLSVLQALFFTLSIVFLAFATSKGSVPVAVAISETWPIFAALFVAPLLGERIKGLNRIELFWGLMAFVGVAVVVSDPKQMFDVSNLNIVTASLAALAALSMGISTAIKARCVQEITDEFKIGQIKVYFILQLFFAPLILVWLPISYFIDPTNNQASADIWLTVLSANFGIVFLVFLANLASSVFYSEATLKMKRASDTFIWFFAPVFSFILYALYTGTAIKSHEIIGLMIILSSNIIISLSADSTISFRAMIASILIVGTVCFYVDPITIDNDRYFDAMSVLSIFYVIILSVCINRSVDKKNEEARLLLSLSSFMKHKSEKIQALFSNLMQSNNPLLIKRSYRLLRREIDKEEDDECAEKLDQYALLKGETIGFGYYIVLAAAILASIFIGIFARNDDIISNVFILIYLPSMIFPFFSLLDFSRSEPNFVRIVKTSGRTNYYSRILAGRSELENIFWSSILSFLIIAGYIFVFYREVIQ